MKLALITASILLILALCAGLVLAVIPQYDALKFRALLTDYLSVQLGARVTASRFNLVWKGAALEFQAEGLEIRSASDRLPVLSNGTARGKLFLRDLIRHKLTCTELSIRNASIFLRHTAAKGWNFNLPATQESVSVPSAAWTLDIASWSIENAKVQYRDEKTAPAFEIFLRKVALRGSAAESSVLLQAELQAPLKMILKAEIDRFKKFAIFQALPLSGKGGLKGEIFALDGLLHIKGTGELSGVELTAEGLLGRLAIKVEGQSSGTHPVDWLAHARLSGSLKLEAGRLRKLNVAQAVLTELSEIPTYATLLEPPQPEFPRAFLAERGTPFEKLELDFFAKNGKASLKRIRVSHPLYAIQGQGMLSLEAGEADADLAFLFERGWSYFLITRVRELDAFLIEDARLLIPFGLSGKLASPKTQVRLDEIARHLVEIRQDMIAAKGAAKLNAYLEAHR